MREPEPIEPLRELVFHALSQSRSDTALPQQSRSRGNGEESRTSLEKELEAWGLGEAATRAVEEAATRKATKTPTFFISERSPSSTTEHEDLKIAQLRKISHLIEKNYLTDTLYSEMIEGVGHEYMEQFFGCCESLLAEDGIFALQVPSSGL
ncbi:hypothetical protein GW17_00009950 [Ensete ventricosum]|nr:hypothetical protein GW17_00009950 [Ensete ventricosum]